jgi:hypothetical protein
MPESESTPQTPAQLREARERAVERAQKAEKEAADRALEVAMLRAGVDDTTPVGKMFVRAYDGEPDPEAIRTAWQEVAPPAATAPPAGEPTPPPAQPNDGPTEAEQAAAAARASLAAGATPPGEEPSPDPWTAGEAARAEALKAGKTIDNADAEVWDRVFNAAAEGDPRVLHDQGRWYAENTR